eukprot:3870257-Prymnesium_polylepis.1
MPVASQQHAPEAHCVKVAAERTAAEVAIWMRFKRGKQATVNHPPQLQVRAANGPLDAIIDLEADTFDENVDIQ